MPSKTTLTRDGRSDLINAIWIFGGQEAVAERLDLLTSQHPAGYWHEFDRVEEALHRFIATHGEPGIMPTMAHLKEHGHHSLCHAIHQHGGRVVVAERMGLTLSRQRHPDHYWDDLTTLGLAVKQFNEDHGSADRLPGKNLLARHGRQDLIGAIRLHGGWRAVALKLGLAEIPLQKPDGYWLSLENVALAIDSYNQTHGTPGQMPGQTELNRTGHSTLARAISVYHGGFAVVASRLGLTYTGPRPPGYWQEWINLEQELVAYIRSQGTLGRMPLLETLKQHKRYDLINALATHGGYHAVAGRLGLTTSYRPPGYWERWENLAHEFLEWAREHDQVGVMSTSNELTATGRADLVSAAYKHGGLLAVADKLGWQTGQGQHRFSSWADVAAAVHQFVADHGEKGVMPSTEQLLQHGRSDILRAIYKWGGGLTQAALRLGLECRYPREIKWRVWSQFAPELEAFVAQWGNPGVMPGTTIFRTAGRSDLLRVIQLYHGGLARVARRLGLAYAMEPQRYWQTFEHVAEALFVFMETHEVSGVIPTHQLLRAQGASTLSRAILNHGGSQYVAEQLGLAYHEKSPGHWHEWTTFAQAIETFMAEQGQTGVLPTQTQLRQAGRTDLEAAIRLHGGMKTVAKRGSWQRARSKPRRIGGSAGE